MFQSVAFLLFAVCLGAVNGQSSTGAPGELRCQYANGTMMPSATVCQDTIGSCDVIFGTPVTTTSTSRPARCDLDDLQDMAAQCARTCGICCESPQYDCLDATVSPIDCAANTRYCRNSNWTNVMAQYCPATCGLCTNGTCTDNIAGCSSMAALCENINWYTYMQTNCARSCGTCSTSSITTTSSTSCSNIASNCAANVALCNNSVYYSLMTTNCAATCGRCSSSSSCTNSNSNCASWVANGFCSSTFYTTAQKAQYCASSCGLC